MECPRCKKGFTTFQQNNEEEKILMDDKVIVKYYHRNYEFCSNVLCNWNEIGRDFLKQRIFKRA